MSRRNWPKLFPYEPRPNQKVIMEHIGAALMGKGHVVAESGTGSGKTICSLAPALDFALKKKKKVLYLTRTNSQQKQVIIELRKINEKQGVFGIGMQGRQNTCRLLDDKPDLRSGTADELSRICGDLKKATLEGGKGCKYYANLIDRKTAGIRKTAAKDLPTVEEFIDLCRKEGDVCPYEANKALLRDAAVVTAPYVYFFNAQIRRSLLDWMGVHISDLVVIVDEAHNLADYARELRSWDLSVRALELAALEAREIGDPKLHEEMHISEFCHMLGGMIGSIADEYVIDEDGLVPPKEVEARIMSYITGTSRDVKVMVGNLVTHGDIIRERKRKRGKLPRSHIFKTALFLQDWMMLDEAEYAKLVVGGDNPRLETYCLNPAVVTDVLNECHSSVHLSGTLAPLIEYRDSIGLPEETACISLPSPFPKENRIILYTEGLTTKYETLARDRDMIPRMREAITAITARFRRNTILFFPSFSLLARFSDLARDMGRDCFFEEQGMTQEELMATVHDFKLGKGSVMFAVMGGRISEGIDFPDRELEIAVLVGIPFPKPTARQKSLLNYYDVKFGKGWEYTVRAPTVRKMMQSIGRLLRRETDRGVALVLDRRMIQFKADIPEARAAGELLPEIEEFFHTDS
jgi:DNA excision repair protein ERCC-2